jgi:outer membrane protein assembly factor BamB
MDAKNILVVGIKGSLLAFHRDTGEKLWSTHLKGSDFVSVAMDEKRVFAHTKGELFCVDLLAGNSLWSDGLKGLGYDIASLAGVGLSGPAAPVVAERNRQQAAASTTTVVTTT